MKRIDYRHYICTAFTVISVALGPLFPNAIPRIFETVRDLCTSFAYYFCWLFFDDVPITPTVMLMPTWEFAPSPFEPLKLFPWTWEEFKALWPQYWDHFFSLKTLGEYLVYLFDGLYTFSMLLAMLSPLWIAVLLLLRRYLTTYNNDYNVDSPQLAWWKRFVF